MKIQNLSVIFIIIITPLILIMSYYISQNSKTLELQEEYNSKILTASKNAIKSFEINTVDWESTAGDSRRNAENMVNTFTRSLANELGISGTAREYMINYIPAILINMYDGYYVYAPTYTPVSVTNSDGMQLFYNLEDQTISTDSTKGEIMYKAEGGGISGKIYQDVISEENIINEVVDDFTINELEAEKKYEHMLSDKIAYTSRYTKGTFDAVVNFTLDNRIYVYATEGTEIINKDGYLAYFDYESTKLPRIEIANNAKDEEDIKVLNPIDNTIYGTKLDSGATNEVPIHPETLTEQIVYKDEGDTNYDLGTFKYLYDIEHIKRYYDDSTDSFFTLTSDNTRQFLQDTIDGEPIKVESGNCKWKSVSVLVGTGRTTEYKKIYQALNGESKGRWYINIKEDEEDTEDREVVDTEIEKIEDMGLEKTLRYAAIYRDYSAISYYVEAYAMTNWVREKLGTGVIEQQVLEYDAENQRYQLENPNQINGEEIFNINKDNNPEDENSAFTIHKRKVMKDSINENLNLSIANYNRGGLYNFRLPILSDNDWDDLFENISILSFVQGMPIGLKYYNNYVIATSRVNGEYVDPNEIYLSGADQKYHLPYCEKCLNTSYTGYRSAEYIQKSFTKEDTNILYYEHDEQGNNNSELGCYYCAVNRENYKSLQNNPEDIENEEKIYHQQKSYNEALARERYYQKENIIGKLDVMLRYHYNTEGWDDIIEWKGLPEDQEVEKESLTTISLNRPSIVSNNQFVRYVFMHWVDINGKKYNPGEDIILTEDKDLYAVWRISLSQLNWKRDYVFINESDAFKSDGEFNNTSSGNVTDGSISYIYIDEMPDGSGSRVQMIGNENKKGKGAAWAEFSAEFLEIAEFSFKYYLNSGHSFNAGGFLFNITETGDMLKGYMLSVNFNHEMLTAGENKTGAIFEFEYKKGNNSEHFEYLRCINSFDLGKVNSSLNSEANGTITIKVEDNGYLITGTELSQDIFIPVNNINNQAVNKFGFFSDHFGSEHGHTCTNIGYFRLEDVVVTVVRNK